NLQAANTVINVDLPWNPAILEQRIGRAHRMGQKRPVQVFLLVTEGTIEENMLDTLSAKHDLALASLDINSEVTSVSIKSGVEELKRRLEVLIGAKKTAPVDVSQKQAVLQQINHAQERREKIATAGGELLGAFAKFLSELTESNDQQPEAASTVPDSATTDSATTAVSFAASDSAIAASNATTVTPAAITPAASFVNQLVDGLLQCLEDDSDGKPQLSIKLPNRGIIDTITDAIAKFFR
ncbi:MAG: hypothetical protein FWD31_07835, partial [Planctomycetaceae bacterium]|nr:hypothetical protein [Planctomycetaceae bacterium]